MLTETSELISFVVSVVLFICFGYLKIFVRNEGVLTFENELLRYYALTIILLENGLKRTLLFTAIMIISGTIYHPSK